MISQFPDLRFDLGPGARLCSASLLGEMAGLRSSRLVSVVMGCLLRLVNHHTELQRMRLGF